MWLRVEMTVGTLHIAVFQDCSNIVGTAIVDRENTSHKFFLLVFIRLEVILVGDSNLQHIGSWSRPFDSK